MASTKRTTTVGYYRFSEIHLDKIRMWVEGSFGFKVSRSDAVRFVLHTSQSYPIAVQAKAKMLATIGCDTKRIVVEKEIGEGLKRFTDYYKAGLAVNTVLVLTALIIHRAMTLPPINNGEGNPWNLKSTLKSRHHSFMSLPAPGKDGRSLLMAKQKSPSKD